MAKLKKLLFVAGIGAAVAAVAKRMQSGGQSEAAVWQSPDPGPAAPVTAVDEPPYEPELITDPPVTETDPAVDVSPDPLSDPLPEEPTDRP
jgi:hypothetical protein